MTLDDIAKAVKATPDDRLSEVIGKLFEVPDYDPTKIVCDVLQSRIVKRDGDRNEHDSYLKSFCGPFARDPVGREILATWHRHDQELMGIVTKRNRKPKVVADSGGKVKPLAQPVKGEDGDRDGEDHAARLDRLARAYAAANKCSVSKAYDLVMTTDEGRALRQQDNYA